MHDSSLEGQPEQPKEMSLVKVRFTCLHGSFLSPCEICHGTWFNCNAVERIELTESQSEQEACMSALEFYPTWLAQHQCKNRLMAQYCYAEFAEMYAQYRLEHARRKP